MLGVLISAALLASCTGHATPKASDSAKASESTKEPGTAFDVKRAEHGSCNRWNKLADDQKLIVAASLIADHVDRFPDASAVPDELRESAARIIDNSCKGAHGRALRYVQFDLHFRTD